MLSLCSWHNNPHFHPHRSSKRSQRLGEHWKRGVPIEVLPMAYRCVQLAIEGQHGGTAPLRLAKQKAVCTGAGAAGGGGEEQCEYRAL